MTPRSSALVHHTEREDACENREYAHPGLSPILPHACAITTRSRATHPQGDLIHVGNTS
jgi:hypothetical protein